MNDKKVFTKKFQLGQKISNLKLLRPTNSKRIDAFDAIIFPNSNLSPTLIIPSLTRLSPSNVCNSLKSYRS